MAEELVAAGFAVHLAEPSKTATLPGRKKRAKTDRADAGHLGELLEQGRLPESWVPAAHLLDQRTKWQQRIPAVLFHHRLPKPPHALPCGAGRAWPQHLGLPASSRLLVVTGLGEIAAGDAQIAAIDRRLAAYGRRQPGCRALVDQRYGLRARTAPTVLAEPGDARRFRNQDAVVRETGPDVTVYSADGKPSPGHRSRQGPQGLGWAVSEAAKSASATTASDHDHHPRVRDRRTANRAWRWPAS